MSGDPGTSPRGGARRFRDPRVWLGLAVTVFFLWLTLRDVPFAEVGRVIAGANWWVLIGLSLPLYLVLIWLRALRWGHLTDPIAAISRADLGRAVEDGFEVLGRADGAEERGCSIAADIMLGDGENAPFGGTA